MPPKKKQKTVTPSSSKPTASSSKSTRSRTRSASAASSAPTKKTKRRLVKAEPVDGDVDLLKDIDFDEDDKHGRLSPVWHGDEQPRMECYVELPPPPTLEEDRLMFIRPKNRDSIKAKGKQKEQDGSRVLHVDHEPAEFDPFHFSEQDLEAFVDSLIAIRPKKSKKVAKSKSRPASVRASPSKQREATEEPVVAPAVEARADSIAWQSKSRSASIQPSLSSQQNVTEESASTPSQAQAAQTSSSRPQRATELLQMAPATTDKDGLEDMFLGSEEPSTSKHTSGEDGVPLFFENSSDEEDALRNGTPAGTQSRIKKSPDQTSSSNTASSGARPNTLSEDPHKKSQKEKETEKQERLRLEKLSKKEKKVERKEREEERFKKEAEDKSQTGKSRQVDSDDDSRVKHKSDDVKDLRSDLNEDAFARSTGVRHKEEYRNKLAAFAQARKKAKQDRAGCISSGSSSSDDDEDGVRGERKRTGNGKRATTVSSDSETSDSDDSSDDSSNSDSDDSKDLIVGDDEVEYDEGFQPEKETSSKTKAPTAPILSQKSTPSDGRSFKRDSDGRIRLVPVSQTTAASTSTSVLAAHGLGGAGARKGLDELCLDWLEWAVARVLVTWSALSLPDRERLERNRAALKSRVRSTEESVGSVSMRRQFKWYLTQYPKIQVEPVFSDEVDQFGSLAKQGCGICHRKSQKAQFKITFSGLRYNQQTLAPLKKDIQSDSESSDSDDSDSTSSSSDSDSDSASDRSDDNETWREVGIDVRSRPTFTFFAGNHCAQRAAVMHQLHHWEWTTMQTLAKHDSIRYIRRQLWRPSRNGKGKDGKMGAGAYEVAFCVSEMISPTGRCTWKGKEKEEKEAGGGGAKRNPKTSELDRLRRRLKGLNEQAVQVNGAR